MVLSMWILGCSRLTAYFNSRKTRSAACATENRHPHSLGNHVIILLVDFRLMLLSKAGINHCVADLFHDMRGIEMTSVGYRGTQIGYLKWCGEHLSLADSY